MVLLIISQSASPDRIAALNVVSEGHVRFATSMVDKRISLRLLFLVEVIICLAFKDFKVCYQS